MKRNIVTIIMILFVTANSVSQNMISLQHGSVTSLFTAVDSAINHASAGDTIYLPGGVFTIHGYLSKPIHLIGVGHNPTHTNATNYTYLLEFPQKLRP